jgi:hypothetical protein
MDDRKRVLKHLDRHVDEERGRAQSDANARVASIDAELSALAARLLSEPTDRRYIRLRRDIGERITTLNTERQRYASGSYLREFDATVAPFLEKAARHHRRRIGGGNANAANATAESSADLVSEFFATVGRNPPVMRFERDKTCATCGGEMRLVMSRALLVCVDCGVSVAHLDATAVATSYADEPMTYSNYAYKRLNRTRRVLARAARVALLPDPAVPRLLLADFNEWLLQLQGKETFEIGDDVVQQVRDELRRQRVDSITPGKVRDVLKSLRMRKTYEHSVKICAHLTGRAPHTLDAETEEVCRLMFRAIQPLFETYAPKTRKNFLSYGCVVHQLHGWRGRLSDWYSHVIHFTHTGLCCGISYAS